ncbi:GIY-YIG nuclease family protein [Sphingomonas sp. 8AM]|uniref:GIY-YIG nuclease family protein n=1 Tax=Sphingomonas sp. 8AM TaxID=2653170 RepID=UPI0012F4028D|nr:GIY-YIG nuclease family protein [Sphingomonas sp. 8AM]VXC65253.1 conserved hypothetical protein [Sphingomonas sp. 8AM]
MEPGSAETQRVFFTYVWGPPGNPAWPLTFTNKATRSHALKALTEGDLIFTVCTRGEPTPFDHRGRVSGLYRVSDLEVNTQEYDIPRALDQPEFDSVSRFPYALHPIAVWEINSPDNIFSALVGPLTPTHHLQAQSKIVELDAITAQPLLALARRELAVALPRTELGRGRVLQKNSKLAPKHQGTFIGTFGNHETWFVYTLVLRDSARKALAVKVGYANNPQERADAHNGPMAYEATGLRWHIDLQQPTTSEDVARNVEQAVLTRYAGHRLASNGEILRGVDPASVATAVAIVMRSLAAVD